MLTFGPNDTCVAFTEMEPSSLPCATPVRTIVRAPVAPLCVSCSADWMVTRTAPLASGVVWLIVPERRARNGALSVELFVAAFPELRAAPDCVVIAAAVAPR